MKSKAEIVVALGNLIMGPNLSKEDKEVIFDAYKLLGDYVQEESSYSKFAKAMAKREEDAEYIKWRDEYVEQMTWFYKYLGLTDVHAVGDILYLGCNDVLGYDLKALYNRLSDEPEEEQ